MGFLGFFNREYREHDYLWGRLNGADRLVDILERVASDGIDEIEVLLRELFESIVERERHRLYRCDDDFARLDAELARMAEK